MKSLMPQIDSNDGLFHNGNPATGEQGTRVTDTWLNNLQDRVRDVQAEAHYVLQKAGFTPKAETQTQLYQAIVKIIDDNRKSASTTQKGEVRLTSDTGLDSEELGLTAKAGKKLAQQTAQLQLNVSQNYIQNSKKSSAVDSNSEENVATSAAVKKVYDLANGKQPPATTLAGYGIGNFKIENFVGNVNSLQTDGIYAVTQASRSQNLPVAGNGCHIQVIAGGDGRWCRQIAYIAYSTDMYERHQTSYQTDSWSAWVKIDGVDKLSKTDIIGEVAFFARTTPPSGWLKANGAAISRTTYAALFSAIGTTFGAGDGRTTFNLPDLRGEFLRCLDDGRNIDRDRILGTAQGDAIRNITGKLDGSAMGSGNQVLEGKMIASGAIGTTYQQRQWSGDQGGWGEQSVSFDFDASRVVPIASENRPRNVALLACIKY